MTQFAIEYLMDAQGNPKAVVIPIEVWRKLVPQENNSLEALAENLEDYCLNKAMDEAKATSLLRDVRVNSVPTGWVSTSLNPRWLKVERSRNLVHWYRIFMQVP